MASSADKKTQLGYIRMGVRLMVVSDVAFVDLAMVAHWVDPSALTLDVRLYGSLLL